MGDLLGKDIPKGMRIERDTMGEMLVPEGAYYGAQTARALENFQISGLRFPRPFIRALGLIKLCAAKANMELGLLDKERGEAIVKASEEVVEGKLEDQFVVDVFQTGSGTSTNMNANEVIASRASELLTGRRGDKRAVHPNDHVNMGQSTNDVFPTAIHVACVEESIKSLIPSLRYLAEELKRKSAEFNEVVKSGRTHLQDAVPITLGQEFSGYATMIEHGIERVEKALDHMKELPIGGTAVGTGLNAHPKFADIVVREISKATGIDFKKAENRFESMQAKDACVELSGALKVVAGSILRIANDLRLLSSGPRTGLAEIEVPATQPGSSIMPGKVNPVILESVCMVSAQVMGNDLAVTLANQLGELELNMGMPLIAYDLVMSIKILASASRNLAERCIKGIRASYERCKEYAESSPALITVIAPIIGYDNAAKIAKLVLEEGLSVKEAIVKQGILSEGEAEKILDIKRIAQGGIIAKS